MTGFYRRYLLVVLRFLPFALAFVRDRRRFLLVGSPRRVPERVHRRRAERVRDTMLELGPAFIKVGQVLSTRPDIVPPVYAETFGTLQDEVPEDAGGDPRTVVAAELGDELDVATLEPVAGGSLAFVYAVDYRGERVALKVRRPGVKAQVERDLRVVRALVPVVSRFVDERQRYSLRNVADDFESVILDELDFDRERAFMAEIRADFEGDDRVTVPAVYPSLSSGRLLAMEYRTGRKVTDPAALEGSDLTPHDLAERIARVYMEMGLVHGAFHADPHPGNLAVTAEGSLLLFDFGMSARLPPAVREDVVRLYRALVRRDVDRLVDALVALEVLEPDVDRAEVGRVLELVIRNLAGRTDVTWRAIIRELTAMLRDFPFRIPPDVMLLVRVGTVTEGVCRQLDPAFDFIAVIRSVLVEQGFIESELRSVAGETLADLQRSAPALARAPARLDRALDRLERGEVVVRTDPVDRRPGGDPHLGYAVLAGALAVAAAVLSLGTGPSDLVAAALAAGFLFVYVARRFAGAG